MGLNRRLIYLDACIVIYFIEEQKNTRCSVMLFGKPSLTWRISSFTFRRWLNWSA